MSPTERGEQLISLVRHADAGDRSRFTGDDFLRPLSKRGRREAEEISRRFEDREPEVASSPYLRCIETLAPLSARLRRSMVVLTELGEGGAAGTALEVLLARLGRSPELVACSHGDVMTDVIELLHGRGTAVRGPVILEKASTTELTVSCGEIVAVAFVPPPSR